MGNIHPAALSPAPKDPRDLWDLRAGREKPVLPAPPVPRGFKDSRDLRDLRARPDITISQPGIYQASFHSTVSTQSGESIPATLTVNLALNGATLPGASATHTFTTSAEASTLSFTVPFQVTTTPSTLTAVPVETGFPFDESSLTVVRLGDVPA